MSNSHDVTALGPEEAWLWACARSWPDLPEPVDPAGLDWNVLVDIGVRNRMQVLIERVLVESGARDALPPAASEALHTAVQTYVRGARDMTDLLRRYLPIAHDRGVDSVVFKGMHLCEKVYRDPEVRPGNDIDLLVRRHQVADSVAILEELGLGRFWPALLDDSYYDRHHLHLQRCTPDHRVWVDVHWALDHPYTCLTVDYDALMDRARASTLVGAPVLELSATDDLLGLAVHLVKHAVYLPAVLSRPDLRRIILADGFLMYFVDIVAALHRRAEGIDWPEACDRARAWGAAASLHSSLRVSRDWLAAPIPDEALESLAPEHPGTPTRWLMGKLTDQKIAQHDGNGLGAVATFLFGYNDPLVLRPVRLLDVSSFLFPSAEYLQRRYGSASWTRLVGHVAGALIAACRFAVDTLYYSAKRQLHANPRPPTRDGCGADETAAL